MTIETALRAKIIALSTTAGSRIYAVTAPQNATKPYAVYQRTSLSPIHSHDGVSALKPAVFQITCLAATPDAARALAKSIRAGIDGTSGVWSSMTIGAVFCNDESDDPYIDIPGSADGMYGVSADFEIWFEES